VLKKHTKLIENRFSRSKVIQNSIDWSVGTFHNELERLAVKGLKGMNEPSSAERAA
jgi:hypothetical protein